MATRKLKPVVIGDARERKRVNEIENCRTRGVEPQSMGGVERSHISRARGQVLRSQLGHRGPAPLPASAGTGFTAMTAATPTL